MPETTCSTAVRDPVEVLPADCERLMSADYGSLLGHTIRVQPLRAAGARIGRVRRVVRPGVDHVRVHLRRSLPAGHVLTVHVCGPAYAFRYRLRLAAPTP